MCAAPLEQELEPAFQAMLHTRVRRKPPIWQSLRKWRGSQQELNTLCETLDKLCVHPHAFSFLSNQLEALDLNRIRRLAALRHYRDEEDAYSAVRRYFREKQQESLLEEEQTRAASLIAHFEQLLGGDKSVLALLPQQLLRLQPDLVELKKSKRSALSAADDINHLIEAIGALNNDNQRTLVDLIKARQPAVIIALGNDEDDVEIDIDHMDQATLQVVRKFVQTHKQ